MVQITEDIHQWQPLLATVWPGLEVKAIASTASTNTWVREHRDTLSSRATLAITDSQTAGRGSGTNHWESQDGCNLTFSLCLHPHGLRANRMFALSEAMSLGVAIGLEQAVRDLTDCADAAFSIKWPNDIYHHDGKVCGMLIENDLSGRLVERSVIGVGINVRQTRFLSDAPNPTSLSLLTGQDIAREEVLARVLSCFRNCLHWLEREQYDALHAQYMNRVYRLREWHRFTDQGGTFEGMIQDIQPDGHLLVTDRAGTERRYAFGEIKYII